MKIANNLGALIRWPFQRIKWRKILSKKWLKQNGLRWVRRFLVAWFGLTLILRFVPVPFSAYMAQQKIGHLASLDFSYDVQYEWVPLEQIAWPMQLAVLTAEDQQFPNHWGFDFSAIKKAFQHNEHSRKVRGASTISQQTAKNLYLWHGQSWLRKGIEVPTTLMLELLWSKKRILEVYLNIAEFGDGIFGVQAASLHYFRKPASQLNQQEAALLAAILPNPIAYKANRPGPIVKRRQRWIINQMNRLGKGYLDKLN